MMNEDEDALGMQIYDLENQVEAMARRISDLEKHIRDETVFLVGRDLPYKLVKARLETISGLLNRELSSYRS